MIMENTSGAKQPLLSPTIVAADDDDNQVTSITTREIVVGDDHVEEDIPLIKSPEIFFKVYWLELKKTMYLAGPSTFMRTCQYSLGAITITISGQLSTLDLAAFAVENTVIAGFSFGVLLGMGSALETLCGQAFGAKRINMLGVYLQRSWVILNTTALLLSLLYIFATPLLKLVGETTAISEAAGRVATWMIPQLFAYAMVFPIIKYLQAQCKVMTMAAITGIALLLHAFFSWLFMLKLWWGLAGGAAVLNISWWFIVLSELAYIFSGRCGEAWSGFSWKAFHDLWGFVRLSVASAVMLCMNILGWTMTVALGFNAAVSVRVSNELGAARPRMAKFSVLVAVTTSFLLGLIMSSILIIYRKEYPAIFTNSKEVQDVVIDLTPILALSIVINNFQPVLSGVAIGAGWQALIAYINVGCYYILGIPLGLTLGYVLGFGVKGIWLGMLSGTCAQTIILFSIVYKTNWNKEASIAGERIRKWEGTQDGNTEHEKKLKDAER